jgi:hypothetical protein
MMDGVGEFRMTCPVSVFISRSSRDIVDTEITLKLGEVFENVVGAAVVLGSN